MAISPDHRWWAVGTMSGDVEVREIRAVAGSLLNWPLQGPGNGYDQAVGLVHFDPAGGRLGVVNWDGRLRVFDARH